MPYLADFILSFVSTDRLPIHLTSYVPGKTPFSTWPAVISMTVTYLAIIFGTRETMKDKPALKLTTLFRAHNLMLSIGSLILMSLICEEVVSIWLKPEIGTYGSLCASAAYTNRLEFYLMVNYYFKYYEFIDTVFLVLKKKPLSFLHVYHHAATAILVFVQLNGRATACWVAAILNLGVHVLMYYYYATAGGTKLWWKQHLTTIQIIQFVIMLTVGGFTSYQFVAYEWFPEYLPHMGGCSVTPTASIVGIGITSSYLLLFLDFFYETYLQKAKSQGMRRLPKSTIASTGEPIFCVASSGPVCLRVGQE
ncbi:GNS1/SUR4 family domain containing protein [Tylopilus felleus]